MDQLYPWAACAALVVAAGCGAPQSSSSQANARPAGGAATEGATSARRAPSHRGVVLHEAFREGARYRFAMQVDQPWVDAPIRIRLEGTVSLSNVRADGSAQVRFEVRRSLFARGEMPLRPAGDLIGTDGAWFACRTKPHVSCVKPARWGGTSHDGEWMLLNLANAFDKVRSDLPTGELYAGRRWTDWRALPGLHTDMLFHGRIEAIEPQGIVHAAADSEPAKGSASLHGHDVSDTVMMASRSTIDAADPFHASLRMAVTNGIGTPGRSTQRIRFAMWPEHGQALGVASPKPPAPAHTDDGMDAMAP